MIGILTDKGQNDAGKMVARINDVPHDVPHHLYADLACCERRMQVEYAETNRVLSRIAPVKAETAQTPVKPEIKPYTGSVLSINWTTKAIALTDGPILSLPPELEAAVDQFKPRYKVKVEHDGDRLVSIKSNFVPSNDRKPEKLITMQHNFTAVSGIFSTCTVMQPVDFEESLELIYGKAKEITERMMNDCRGA